MNRTIKDATVRRYHYGSHDELRQHLQHVIDAYNHGRRLKTLRGLTPYEYVARIWTEDPTRFKSDPYRHTSGLNTWMRYDQDFLPSRPVSSMQIVLRHEDTINCIRP